MGLVQQQTLDVEVSTRLLQQQPAHEHQLNVHSTAVYHSVRHTVEVRDRLHESAAFAQWPRRLSCSSTPATSKVCEQTVKGKPILIETRSCECNTQVKCNIQGLMNNRTRLESSLPAVNAVKIAVLTGGFDVMHAFCQILKRCKGYSVWNELHQYPVLYKLAPQHSHRNHTGWLTCWLVEAT